MNRWLERSYRIFAGSLCLVVLSAIAVGSEEEKLNRLERFRLRGFVAYENFSFLENRDAELIAFRNEVKFLPDLDMRFSDQLRGALAVEFREDFSDSSRSRVFLDKASLDTYLSNWDLRLGRQIISWGRTDVIKPTDNFTRHDYTDFIENAEEPIDAVKVDYYIGDWNVQGVWAPIFQPDLLRLDPRNRWSALPRRADLPGVGTFDLTYRVDNSARPVKNPTSSQAGVRVMRQHGGVDWSASYYYGYDRLPTFVKQRVVAVDLANRRATIELTPVHNRIHVLGSDGATQAGTLGIRGEISYTLTEGRSGTEPLAEDPYLRFVGGVDHTFRRILFSHDLYINVQYLLDTESQRRGMNKLDGVDVGINDVSAQLRHFYAHALLSHLEFKLSEFKKVVARGFVNLEQGDSLIQTEFVWQLRDGWTWTIGGDFMDGKAGSFFGLYRRNDRLRTSIKYNF